MNQRRLALMACLMLGAGVNIPSQIPKENTGFRHIKHKRKKLKGYRKVKH